MGSLKKFILFTVQVTLYPLFLLVRLALVRGTLHRSTGVTSYLHNNASYVIYANHQSNLDPIVILSSLPFSVFVRLAPVRSFVKNVFFDSFLTNIAFRLCGCFPAYATTRGLYGLDKARTVMQSKQTILIFPSGKRTRESIARSGVSVLATESSVYLLPIFVNWPSRLSCEVKIGSPFKVQGHTDPLLLMEQVYQLEGNLDKGALGSVNTNYFYA
jgi:1-acyl-sn-glycerol-3-phosphate acyltransferase